MTKEQSISINQKISFSDFLDTLITLNYYRVPSMVIEKGEFTIRGSIIDIYGVNHSHPLRIEVYENRIDRLSTFHVHTQRSLNKLTETVIAPVVPETLADNVISSKDMGDAQLLPEIDMDSYVVHEIYGIGQYKGLQHITYSDREGDFMVITYKGKDRLYVPLEQMALVHHYSGTDVVPKINGLSDGSWQRKKKKVQKATTLLAEDIYLLYKQRINHPGYAFPEDTEEQIDLEEGFEFPLTKDQFKVLMEIKQSMEAPYPMDRLLCGDVGFGKTEVLLRAAFKACNSGKQVAILVPTTILAEQHYSVFYERFDAFRLRVDVLSRFKTSQEQKEIIDNIKRHDIDLIIGTHRLLNKNIRFSDLGLLIIDEEHRFGVSQKEKIQQIKSTVDVISVSATPIPRTLYMSLSGARDFSLIKKPPKDRRPIITSVGEYSKSRVKDAILKELKRNGQIFYVFNNVRLMQAKCKELSRLVPKARLLMAHGQMKERELERIMQSFYHHDADILVCSTIIESGIDITNVNTIIIDSVHRLGISQIHQLRGRVGRRGTQAYAYLFYDNDVTLSEKAHKRLRAIKQYATLGSGYNLALKDLEIRGAGALLGKKQHGHLITVGFELYSQLLEDAVSRLKKRDIKPRNLLPIDPSIKAFIPDDYVNSMNERLAIYQKLSRCLNQKELKEIRLELIDRYGPLPKVVIILFNDIMDQMSP